MMELLRNHPHQKTVQRTPPQLLGIGPNNRKKMIDNYFYKFACNGDGPRELTFADLLEYLKRIVFKAACIMTLYHQKQKDDQPILQKDDFPALNAYLEELEFKWPADEDSAAQNIENDQE